MQNIYDNADKFRCKKLAWMREPYLWHIVHTDYMVDTSPRSPPQSDLALRLRSKQRAMPFGFNLIDINPNGPNR